MIAVFRKWEIFNDRDLTLKPGVSVGLDLIRGLSAQMVLIGHALSYYGIYPNPDDPTPFYMQNLGVLIFFILSGFLITLTTRKKAQQSPLYGFSKFFMDRFIRIFTAYLPAIVFVTIVDYISILLNHSGYGHYEAFNLTTLAGNILMLQDLPEVVQNSLPFIKVTSFGSARPFWTIAIEWWFYLFFGWLFLFKRIQINLILKFTILLLLLIIPLYNLRGGRANCLTFLWWAGFSLSYVYNSDFILKHRKVLFLFGVGLLSILFFILLRRYEFKVYNYQIGAIVTAIIFCLVLCFQKYRGLFTNSLVNRLIRLVANFSFTLYLIHYTILNFFHEILQFSLQNPMLGFLTSVIISNIVAFVLAYFTEFHHRKLRTYILKIYKV